MQGFLDELQRGRVIAIVRGLDVALAVRAAEALRAGGVTLIEITTDSPGWEDAVSQLAREADHDGRFFVGTGTVMTVRHAERACQAGATFLVSPVFSDDVADFARERQVAYVPGALTPTEIHRAQTAGAACVKVFPAGALGPDYIRDLLQPLPALRLVPTGGITVDTATGYLEAGAIAVALGSGLVNAAALRANDSTPTRVAAERLLRRLPSGRSDHPTQGGV
jgi:2-dehydro-3-deoxyphosphogluconate aldolase / (4S)-4-hydroxy-2-oxoglutarate aldolase